MLTLTVSEIVELTGGYIAPAAQLRELHRQGFFRARRSKLTGAVILEREHYSAVMNGTAAPMRAHKPEPTIRPPKLRAVT